MVLGIIVGDGERVALLLEVVNLDKDAVLSLKVSITDLTCLLAIVPCDDSALNGWILRCSPLELNSALTQNSSESVGLLGVNAAARYYPLLVDIILILTRGKATYECGYQRYI